ncbi:hypothetical protein BH20VER1_BH20VER1_31070 [soil metagenome]
MGKVSLRAHFDGEHIVLDEPFTLAPNSSLLVTVLTDGERLEWSELSARSLSRAYSEDEPDYTSDDLARE